MSADYDVFAAIRTVLRDTDLTDPDEVAEKVIGDVPAKQLRPILRRLLRETVRVQMSYVRRHPGRPVEGDRATGRSAKVTAIRDAWRRRLHDRYNIGGGYRFLGELTVENVEFCASERRRQAESNLTHAAWFDELADQMRSHRVARVDALPEPVLARLLSDRQVAA